MWVALCNPQGQSPPRFQAGGPRALESAEGGRQCGAESFRIGCRFPAAEASPLGATSRG